MATKLGKTLSYQITADTSGFTRGVTATRGELRDAKKIMEEMQTPAQRYESQLEDLGNLHRKGAISSEAYNRKIRQMRIEKMTGIPVIGRYATMIGNISPQLLAVGAAAGAVTFGLGMLTAAARSGLRAIADSVRLYAETGNSLSKLSRQTRVSVSDLSLLKSMARQTSVEFDDLSGAIEEGQIRIGEAVLDNTGPAVAALNRLGLSAAELERQTFVERLKSIADALNDIRSASQRQFLADEIFGGDAFKILPLLDQGSKGIERIIDRSRQLGGLITDEQARNAVAFTRAIGDAKEVVSGLALQIGAEAAPQLRRLVDEFISLTDESSQLGNTLRTGIGQIGPALGGAIDMMNFFIGQLQTAQSVGLSLSGTFLDIATAGADVLGLDVPEGLRVLAETQHDMARQLLDEAGDRLTGQITEAAKKSKEQSEAMADGAQAAGRLADRMADAQQAIEATASSGNQLRNQLSSFLEGQNDQQLGFRVEDAAQRQLINLANQVDAFRDSLDGRDAELFGDQLEQLAAMENQLNRARQAAQTTQNERQAFDLLQRGRQLTQALRTDSEQLADEIKDLQRLLNVGAIDAGTFERAMADARERLEKPITIRYDTIGVDAAVVGSQQAAQALARFRRDNELARGQITGSIDLGEARAAAAERNRPITPEQFLSDVNTLFDDPKPAEQNVNLETAAHAAGDQRREQIGLLERIAAALEAERDTITIEAADL